MRLQHHQAEHACCSLCNGGHHPQLQPGTHSPPSGMFLKQSHDITFNFCTSYKCMRPNKSQPTLQSLLLPWDIFTLRVTKQPQLSIYLQFPRAPPHQPFPHSTFCMPSLLTCHYHADLSLPLGYYPFSFISNTLFGFPSSLILKTCLHHLNL